MTKTNPGKPMEKETILSEIRRIAEMDGTPPGRQRFEKLTGINRTAWYGTYWARWGDALTDAGLQPNEKNPAIDASELMDAYLSLVAELGRVPTEGELKVRSKSDPTFPAQTTFRKRLGVKHELLSKILGYAKTKEDQSVIALLEAALKTSKKPHKQEEVLEGPIGFVYLMKSGKYYKIGKTNTLDRRRYEIGLQLPEGIEPIHSIETDDPSGIEAYWHNRFRDKRMNGEWFNLTHADIRVFRKRRFM